MWLFLVEIVWPDNDDEIDNILEEAAIIAENLFNEEILQETSNKKPKIISDVAFNTKVRIVKENSFATDTLVKLVDYSDISEDENSSISEKNEIKFFPNDCKILQPFEVIEKENEEAKNLSELMTIFQNSIKCENEIIPESIDVDNDDIIFSPGKFNSFKCTSIE